MFRGESHEQTKMSSNQRGQDKVLVISPSTLPQPVKTVRRSVELAWCPGVVRCLERRGVDHLTHCQTVTWPALAAINSLAMFCVAGPRQGKTSGWILPILERLMSDDLYQDLPKGVGPRVCVLCDGQDSALQIEAMLADILSETQSHLKVVVASRGQKINPLELNIELCNEGEILIINPSAFVEHEEEVSIDLRRCCHVVVESAEKTLSHHGTAVDRFVSIWKNKRKSLNSSVPDQIVVVAQEWNEAVGKFHRSLITRKFDPLMVFACLVEAAVFRKVQFIPSFHENTESKLTHLCQNILGEKKHKKVICCSEEVKDKISSKLKDCGIPPHQVSVLDSDLDLLKLLEALNSWETSAGTSLIIADKLTEVLMDVPNIPVSLVHMVLDCSKNQFEKRFNFLKSQLESKRGGEVHVLFGPDDRKAFGFLRSLLTRCGNSNEITTEIFEKLQSEDLQDFCSNLVEGKICERLSCRSRHWLDVDRDKVVAGGAEEEVRFRVTELLTPVTYRVTLTSRDRDQMRTQRVFKMARHFSKSGNKEVLGSDEVVEGLEVGVLVGDEVERGRIRRLSGRADTVDVELYDRGVRRRVRPEHMLRLPASLQTASFPAESVLVTVLGLAPLYKDPDWSESARRVVAGHLTSLTDEDVICRGHVLLRSASVLWLDRCQAVNFSAPLRRWLVHMELQTDLVRLGWAVADTKFRRHLLTLCFNAGLEFPQFYQREKSESLDLVEDKAAAADNESSDYSKRHHTQTGGDIETEKRETFPYFNEELFDDLPSIMAFLGASVPVPVPTQIEVREESQLDDRREPSRLREVDTSITSGMVGPENDGERRRCLQVYWHQDSTTLHVSVHCQTWLELEEENVSVRLTADTLLVEVIEGDVVHGFPHGPLKLWGLAQQDSAVVKIKMRKIEIKFLRESSTEWPRLGSEKKSWIHFDFESSNFDAEENNNDQEHLYPPVSQSKCTEERQNDTCLPDFGHDTDTASSSDEDSNDEVDDFIDLPEYKENSEDSDSDSD